MAAKAEIFRTLDAAKQLGFLVEGFEVGSRGQIRVFFKLDPEVSLNDFYIWKQSRTKLKI